MRVASPVVPGAQPSDRQEGQMRLCLSQLGEESWCLGLKTKVTAKDHRREQGVVTSGVCLPAVPTGEGTELEPIENRLSAPTLTTRASTCMLAVQQAAIVYESSRSPKSIDIRI